ncbi:MAG: hypothetical protein V3U79_01425 [Dehalococcoidia bacterium]
MPRGGRRPGAGAPIGNFNRLKHGRNPRQFQKLLDALVDMPEIRDIFLTWNQQLQRRRRRARRVAAVILSQFLTQAPPQTSEEFNQSIDRLRQLVGSPSARLDSE